ncbi:MAG: hypothetical protein Q9191_001926 [Dirinaria sp. TL-2023a]
MALRLKALNGLDIGRALPADVLDHLNTLYEIRPEGETDDKGRPLSRMLKSTDERVRASVQRRSDFERDIVHARLSLNPVEGSFARIAVYLRGKPCESVWSPKAIATFHTLAQSDAEDTRSGGEHAYIVPLTTWDLKAQPKSPGDIKRELDEAWSQWVKSDEVKQSGLSPLNAIMCLDKYTYDVNNDLHQELWKHLTGEKLRESLVVS